MVRPVIVVDPAHGGDSDSFYDLDNGVRLGYGWDDVSRLDPAEKRYFSSGDRERWERGELDAEPRFWFSRRGRRITYGDPGCPCPSAPGLWEKDLVLDLSRSILWELAPYGLVRATRERDGYVSAESRACTVERLRARHAGRVTVLHLHADSGAPGLRVFRPTRESSFEAERLVRALVRSLDGALPWEASAPAGVEQVGPRLPGVAAVVLQLGAPTLAEDAERLLDRTWREGLARGLREGLEESFGKSLEAVSEWSALDTRAGSLLLFFEFDLDGTDRNEARSRCPPP